MPVFAYKGITAAGKNVTGMRDAESDRAVKAALRREGIYPTSVKLTGRDRSSAGRAASSQGGTLQSLGDIFRRVSTQDLAVATRQLATLIHAGIPLVESLMALVDQTENERFKSIWGEVKQDINEGQGLADAMSKHPRAFNGLYVNMIRAGEHSGALDIVLNRLADFTESQAKLKTKLIGTMFYPIIMLLMSGVVIAILFTFVIPKITKIFESQKVALPILTQGLIAVSTLVSDWWFVLLPSIVLVLFGFRQWVKTPTGTAWWDRTTLKLPVFGPLLRMLAVSRFTKTLATLISSGVPLLTAFDIVKNIVGNTVLVKVIEESRDAVKEGDSIAAPLKRSGQFPALVTHMIAIGEKTGQLEEMLGKVADSYESQVDARVMALTSIMEPVIIVILGVVVALVVFAILTPMVELSSFVG